MAKQCLTRRHPPASEFQRRTKDRRVSACIEVFSDKASTEVYIGERRSYWCARRPEWRSSEKVVGNRVF